VSPGVIKKTFTPGIECLDKGLVDRLSAPVPGLATVLTKSGSAISPADNYSPLEALYIISFRWEVKGDFQ
jgi:hypothetical protein